jgi:phage repressor protein C with HTH and peptisase S24 domain
MKTDVSTQSQRLIELRRAQGLTLTEVSNKLRNQGPEAAKSVMQLHRYEKDDTIRIKKPALLALAKVYHTTPEYIEQGIKSEKGISNAAILGSVEDLPYIKLPFVGPAAYGSFGTNCQDFNPEDFDTYNVLKIPGIDYRDALVMEIKGNSMAPRYPERSRYVIRPVSSGNWQYAQGVHAISLRSAAFIIKRVTHNRDGVLTLTSDNGGAEMSVELGEILCMWKVGEAAYMPAED